LKCIKASFKEDILPGGARSKFPYVSVKVYINGEEYGIVDFLIDTGAGLTVISPKDSLRLGLSRARGRTVKVIGIAGAETANVITGNIRLELLDEESEKPLPVELDSITYRRMPRARGREYQQQLRIPSVLGWDVLRKLIIKMNFNNNIVEICKL